MTATLARNLAVLSLSAITLPTLVGCDEKIPTATKAADAFPASIPVKQGSPNVLETDLGMFTKDHTAFIGKRVQLPVNENVLTFVEQRQINPSDDGTMLFVYDLQFGNAGAGRKYRIFSTNSLEGIAAIAGTWTSFGTTNFLAADSSLHQRVDNGTQSWLWKSFSPIPEPSGAPAAGPAPQTAP